MTSFSAANVKDYSAAAGSVTPIGVLLSGGQQIAASAKATTLIAVSDSGTTGGYLLLNGSRVPAGKIIYLVDSQLSSVKFVAGNTAGVETLTFWFLSGNAWSSAANAHVSIGGGVAATAANITVEEGQTIGASALIASTMGGSIQSYKISNAGTGGGAMYLNGGKLVAGQTYTLTAAQFAQLTFSGGSTAGVDHIAISVSNGSTWSNATTATVTIAPPPTVTAADAQIYAGQTISAASFIAKTSDPAGKAITEYSFMAKGTDGGALYLNGKAIGAGTWITISVSQLAQLTYVGGSGVGTDTVSIKAFDGVGWSAISVATVSETVASVLGQLTDAGIKADVARLMIGDSLSYISLLTILQDAAVGGMTTREFSSLQALASMLDAPGPLSISTSSYVQDIARALIDGDPANATWTGGSSSSVALGNLSATSTQTQVDELIGKWFLGTDLPNVNVTTVGLSNLHPSYTTSTNPLYGAGGAPSYLDVNQGYVGDCYFMAAIAEVALQDPGAIKSMIVNNGNGTYGVRFDINGHFDWVTVNTQLATMGGGLKWANGSSLEFANGSILWPELLEKAYAQLNAEPNVPHGRGGQGNSYAGIQTGSAYALSEITGQSYATFALSSVTSASTLTTDMAQFAAGFSSHQELLVATGGFASSDLLANHMYEVIGYNAASEALILHNPWGSAVSPSTVTTFSETLAQLAANNATVFMTAGKSIA